ncbi:hypothetical protein [Hirschia maritima]|uniref:hypothetical protein n=1 Tax=Hirschia maritima TaxID=1121961 RepID=UPI0003AB206D|nr:hypothetical protein [Hirschia maritima]
MQSEDLKSQFGSNGLALMDASEKVVEEESNSKQSETVLLSLFWVLMGSSCCWWFSSSPLHSDSKEELLTFGLTITMFGFTPACVYFYNHAMEHRRIDAFCKPIVNKESVPGGLIFASIIILATVIYIAGNLQKGYVANNGVSFTLKDDEGFLVLAVIAFAFALLIFLPRIAASLHWSFVSKFFRHVFSKKTPFGFLLSTFGSALSIIDAFFVYVVAPTVGVTMNSTFGRYFTITSYLIPLAVLSWYLPAPFGLLPIVLGFIISTAVARRWSWVEADREIKLRNPKADESKLSIGVEQDLRDEALLALLSLIVMLPLAMRQAHLTTLAFSPDVHLFSLQNNGLITAEQTSFIQWLAFFGTELAKAIPFVDWADIYKVDSNPTIQSVGPYSFHVVFIARAIVDIVFLGALTQAITSSFKLNEHKRLFFNEEIFVLDPFIERVELSKLAFKKNGEWKIDEERIKKFLHYDRIALSVLKLNKNTPQAAREAVKRIIQINSLNETDPQELFSEAINTKYKLAPPSVIAQMYIEGKENEPFIERSIQQALEKLNFKTGYSDVRSWIIEDYLQDYDYPESSSKISILCERLVGPNRESIKENRKKILSYLETKMNNKDHFEKIERAIINSCQSDPANIIKRQAKRILRGSAKNVIDHSNVES